MSFLPGGISLSDLGPRLAPPETQLPEQPLALPHAQIDSIAPFNKGRQRLAVPQRSGQIHLPRRLPENGVDLFKLRRAQSRWPAGAISIRQARQASVFKAMHPIFNRARRVAQQSRRLWASHPLRYQEHCMKPMVVARLLGTADLVLQTEYDVRSIGDP